MTTRAEIVAALAAIPGLTAYPTQPANISAGAAWPAWRQTLWRNQVPGGVRELGWFAYVALGGSSLEATAAEADPLIELVGDALAAADLGILLVEPYSIRVEPGGQGIPVLRFSLGDRS